MKLSEITSADVVEYLRLEEGQYTERQITAIMDAALKYIAGYTGIPAQSETEGETTLDDYEDLWLAFMVLCQDMYDNRSMVPDAKGSANRVVESVLGMHARNLL